jgi:perosamine synthetase
MNQKRIDWWQPQIGSIEQDLIHKVLSSNYINDGDVTTQFEQALAKRLEVKHAVAVTSGTAALYLAVKALGIGPEDEVIVPDVTFIATANAVSMANATPVLVDVEPSSLNVDPQAAEKAITTKTKAIMPVHVSGRPANLNGLKDLCQRRGLRMIEDAAEGLLSKHQGRCLGTIGDLGCFSFSPNKTITTGQGGLVVTNDDALHLRLRQLKDQGRPVKGTGGDDIHHSVGFNFKLTNMQAAVGLGQLHYLDQRLDRQRAIYRAYVEGLKGIEGVGLLGFDLADGTIPQWTDVICKQRDQLDRFLSERNMHCRRFWHPIHSQTPYHQSDERFPVSTKLCPQALWLPSAFTHSDADIANVCSAIREFYRGR